MSYFDAAKRKAIYGAIAAVLGVAVAYGVVTAENVDAILALSDRAIGLIAAAIAFANTGTAHVPDEE